MKVPTQREEQWTTTIEKKRPPARRTHPQRQHTTGDLPTAEDEYNDTFAYHALDEDEPARKQYALDSGAHPSHVRKSTRHMRPLRRIIRTNTANTITPPATHKGMIHIRTSSKRRIRIFAIVHPALRSNLLSVHDIAEQWGEVRVTPTQAIILDTSTNPPQTVAKARFTKGMYYLQFPNVNQYRMEARAAPSMSTKPTKAPR